MKGLTFYSLKNLLAVHTPHPLSPLPPPTAEPSCSFTSFPPPNTLLPSPTCPQASEMHTCFASLCEALSAHVCVRARESVSMAISVAVHVCEHVRLRICGQKKQPFVYLFFLGNNHYPAALSGQWFIGLFFYFLL